MVEPVVRPEFGGRCGTADERDTDATSSDPAHDGVQTSEFLAYDGDLTARMSEERMFEFQAHAGSRRAVRRSS
jgi:hypothetical protein